ncbi:pumilio domain-containing protein [Striga asiatica]|uniref:Pumilio domain-containing protein n=1 Tax=Striga asiatica TaxID=4170 RepID=A0A5A7PSC4_STRAF|nr:pumilio domain-containing protein [Striga asiatica]
MRGLDSNGNLELNTALQNELDSLLLLQQQNNRAPGLERERDLDINRSGSAPPTVEGALGAAGSLFNHPDFAKTYETGKNISATMSLLSENEILSHPAYLEYYYSNENLNPRLPPPTLSKEDWRVAQRIRAAFGLGMNVSESGNNSGGGFGVGSSLFTMQPGLSSVKKSEDDLTELRKTALRNLSRKNSVESFEKGGSSSPGMGARRKSFADILQEGRGQPLKSNLSRAASQSSVADAADSTGMAKSESYESLASASSNPSGLSSQSNSRPELLPADGLSSSASIFEIADIAASLSALNASRAQLHTENIPLSALQMNILNDINYANLRTNEYPRRASSTSNLLQCQHNPSDFAEFSLGSRLGSGANGPGVISRTTAPPPGFHYPVMGPHQIQYLPKANFPHSHDDLWALEKAYLDALLMQRRQQYEALLLQIAASIDTAQYPTNAAFSPSAAPFQENLGLNAQSPIVVARGAAPQKEKNTQMPLNLRNVKGESSGSSTKGRFESLLEMLKNNKSKSLELSDILGHVVELSMDQYGSRFIQQKLECATVEEKTKILVEIIPSARSLMIDFFEHGTESQRKELAGHLIGHVLPLTLQMYGCRVIQKALEVIDVEMQTKMVAELDGSVMKCVHDQNGNHVIQKCIECVPQDNIQFIITPLFGQIVNLSTHTYGCRVIQRVLEHCDDPKTQETIMGEIMSSVCKLAQDQYGNYVIQHVVQQGKPHERSAIIGKLAGQIVKMSQQKFASNVIEKCLTFGGPEERQLLVNEMLGLTDENEPLQAMMKDPFGNYVVQKVIETCDDKSRELILSRIKVHLSALKKYTYGKHIVSRVEKLIATGGKSISADLERRSQLW